MELRLTPNQILSFSGGGTSGGEVNSPTPFQKVIRQLFAAADGVYAMIHLNAMIKIHCSCVEL